MDPSRTLVFAGGQWTSGQAQGESSYAANDVLGTALSRAQLTSPTTLTLTRDFASGTARFTLYVVELLP